MVRVILSKKDLQYFKRMRRPKSYIKRFIKEMEADVKEAIKSVGEPIY